MKNYIILGLAILSVGLAALGWHQRDERLRKEGENRLLQVRNDSLAVVAQESEDARREIVIQAHAIELAQQRIVDSATAVADAATKRRPQVIDRIVEREAPADTAVARRVALEVADSITVHEIRPRDEKLAAKDVIIASLQATVTAESAARQDAQHALAAFKATVPVRPGFIESHGVTLLKLAGAFGAGYEFGRASR